MVDFSVTSLGCNNLSHSHMINLILHNKYMAHLCKNLHMPEYATINHALFTNVFCRPEVIHMPCNTSEYHLAWPSGLWPFCFLAFSVYGLFGLRLFRFVAVSVCGRFGLWLFRFVAVSVCSPSGLWPFRFVAVLVEAVSVVAVSVCGRYDLLPLGIWYVDYIMIIRFCRVACV